MSSVMFRKDIHVIVFICFTLPAWSKLSISQESVSGGEVGSHAKQPLSSYLAKKRLGVDEDNKHRIREGTKITNRLGRFQQSGDRATFVTEEKLELGGLPNLNLERVVRTLKGVDDPEKIWWSVTGTVTEFTGRNYLLIERAVYKSAVNPTVTKKVGSEP